MDEYEPFARFYDLELAGFEADIPFYTYLAGQHGSPILELGCGTGRTVLALARSEHRIVGLDRSPPMLEIARRKLDSQPALADRVQLVEGDMRDFVLDERFRLITLSLNTFMHLITQDDQKRALACIRRHLHPEGRLVIDMVNLTPEQICAPGEQTTLQQRLTDPESGRLILKWASSTLEHAKQLQHFTLIYDETQLDGTVRRTIIPMTLRYSFRFEVELLLEQASFETEAIYGDYDLTPYEGDSPHMIFVAAPA